MFAKYSYTVIVLLAGLDTSVQVRADFRYAGGVIETDRALMSIAENRHRMLTDFLVHTIGKDAKLSDYRDSFYAVNDSTSGQFSIDLVCSPAPDESVKKWLDRLLTNDYITQVSDLEFKQSWHRLLEQPDACYFLLSAR